MQESRTILDVKNLKVVFKIPVKDGFFTKLKPLYAVNDVSFKIFEGETLGIVGESGCGKSTLARAVIQLIEPRDSIQGEVVWLGNDILGDNKKELFKVRKDMQIIFQDPLASLDPRMTIEEIIAEPLKVFNPNLNSEEVKNRVIEVTKKVGLNINMLCRYPHEFSGGQCQRIGIARAIILKPKLLVCDEAVSALDVSIKAQIINLLQDLKKELNMSLIFISHDLSIVKYFSDRVMVLYLGKIMELATSDLIYNNPKHPYTKALISAVPIPDPNLEQAKNQFKLQGDIPSPFDVHEGCPFSSRCPVSFDRCFKEKPSLELVDDSLVACFKVNQDK